VTLPVKTREIQSAILQQIAPSSVINILTSRNLLIWVRYASVRAWTESPLTGKHYRTSCLSHQQRIGSRMLFIAIVLLCLSGWGRAQTAVNIHAIAVSMPASPYLYSTYGANISTTGIVVAVLSDGFYIENPTSDFDSNTCSSEGIYVYTGTGNLPTNAVSGYSVKVTGSVMPSNSSDYAGVQIDVETPIASNVVTQSTGNTLPTAISSSVLTAATSGTCPSYPSGTFGQWLPFEGMRVNVPSSSYLVVTQGTGGTIDAASQTATTNGRFWAVFSSTNSTSARPFRDTGISYLDIVPTSAPSTVQRWKGNPQLLLVDTTALGGTALDASAGTVYSGASSMVGIVDYHVSSVGYTGLLLTSDSVSALSEQGGTTPTAAATRGSDQITVASQNLESSPGVGLTATETLRITKLANAIVYYHKSPDVIAVQDSTLAALNQLVSAISSASGPSYTLFAGSTNLSDGLVDGFLVNTGNFDGTPTAVSALGAATYTTTSGSSATLFDRVPLVLTAKIPRIGISDYTVSIVNASLLPRTSIDDTSLGADVRLRREQQAEQLATQILEPLESTSSHLMVTGGFDSFEFSDGYVDALGILDGSESTNTSAGSLVTLYDSTYNKATLENTTVTATNLTAAAQNPAASRYTYVESGSAEQTDHILITSEMADLISIDYARFGADFPLSQTYNTSTSKLPNRASSHDGVIAYFTIPYPTTTVVATSGSPSYYDASVTFTATVTVTGTTISNPPDGTVTFKDTDGTALGTGTLSNGVATFTTSSLTVGTHTITASYGGSETGLGFQASSGTVQQVVLQDISTLTLGSSPNPSFLGEPVVLTATASSSGVTPSGTVTFFEGATTVGTGTLSSGIATLTISTLTIGSHIIGSSYAGDTTNASATSDTVTQVVGTNTTAVTVTSSKNPSYNGDSVIFTATAVGSYGTPTGTVSFYDASTSTALGTGTLIAGSATYTASAASAAITSLTVGSHTIQATYAGDSTHATATSSVTQVVNTNATTIALVSGTNPSYYGDSVTFTATATGASGNPSGTVIFYNGTTALGSATLTTSATANTATATFAVSTLPVGTDTIQAVYGGTSIHAAGTSNSVSQVVLDVYTPVSTLSCSPNPAQYGATVTCTDAVGASVGTPTGTVTFYDGTTVLGTATLSAGTATYATSSLAVGSHTITAVYARNGAYLASTSNAITEVILSTFSLSATPASRTVYTGEAASYGITVTPGTGFTLDVALTCSGVPANTTCTITPSTVTGGSGTAVLVVQTTAPSQTTTASLHHIGRAVPLLAGLLLLFVPRRWRRMGSWLMCLFLLIVFASGAMTACGGSGSLQGGTPAGSSVVTVTGTATIGSITLTQSTTVNLKVNSMF
jgi:hypothetical protein